MTSQIGIAESPPPHMGLVRFDQDFIQCELARDSHADVNGDSDIEIVQFLYCVH